MGAGLYGSGVLQSGGGLNAAGPLVVNMRFDWPDPMVTVAVLLFLSVVAWAGAVVFIDCPPKSRLAGVAVIDCVPEFTACASVLEVLVA